MALSVALSLNVGWLESPGLVHSPMGAPVVALTAEIDDTCAHVIPGASTSHTSKPRIGSAFPLASVPAFFRSTRNWTWSPCSTALSSTLLAAPGTGSMEATAPTVSVISAMPLVMAKGVTGAMPNPTLSR